MGLSGEPVRKWTLLSVYGPTDGEATVTGPTVLPPEPVDVVAVGDVRRVLAELDLDYPTKGKAATNEYEDGEDRGWERALDAVADRLGLEVGSDAR